MNFEGLTHLKKKVAMENKAMMIIPKLHWSYPLHIKMDWRGAKQHTTTTTMSIITPWQNHDEKKLKVTMKNRGQGASRAKVAHLNKVAMKNTTMSSLTSSLLALLLSILAHYNTFSNPPKKKQQQQKKTKRRLQWTLKALFT